MKGPYDLFMTIDSHHYEEPLSKDIFFFFYSAIMIRKTFKTYFSSIPFC